jgi:hypothetical protein
MKTALSSSIPSCLGIPGTKPPLEDATRVLDASNSAGFPRVGTEEWAAMNRERADLIRRKVRNEPLTPVEVARLQFLQEKSLEALDRTCPRQRLGE